MITTYSATARRAIAAVLLTAVALTAGASTAVGKERVLVFGDSLMKLVARSIEKKLDRNPEFESVAVVSIGSGLARLDLFDWESKIEQAVESARPKYAVAMIGANDDQPMMTDGGSVQLGSPAWLAEYQRRVDSIIRMLKEGGVEKIYWIGLPDMRDSELQREVQRINKIVAEKSRGNPAVEYIDTTKMFSNKLGEFSPYIIDKKTAMPIHVRAGDGVHLNRKGADMLADVVVDKLR